MIKVNHLLFNTGKWLLLVDHGMMEKAKLYLQIVNLEFFIDGPVSDHNTKLQMSNQKQSMHWDTPNMSHIRASIVQ